MIEKRLPNSGQKYTSDLIHNELVYSYGYDVFSSFSAYLKYALVKKYASMSALDAGCANGLFSIALAPYFKNIHGVDINHDFIHKAIDRTAELNIDNISYSFGNLIEIPCESNTFDVVFSFSVLLLVSDFHKAVSECVRVTKPGGYVILDITGKHNLSQKVWCSWYEGKGHHDFTALEWSDVLNLCASNNLNMIESHALGFLDQWKYLPLIRRVAHKLGFVDKCIHTSRSFDLDYQISNTKFFNKYANRWYIVCQKI